MSHAVKKETITFTLKSPRPGEHRKSWSLLKCTRAPFGKRSYEKVDNEALKAINDLFLRGLQNFEESEKQVLSLKRRLTLEANAHAPSLVFNQANLQILGDMQNPAPGSYWKEVYGKKKRIIDKRSSYYDLRRAVEAIGTLSLLTATEEEIQDKIDKLPPRKQRRVISRLQPILKFLSRSVTMADGTSRPMSLERARDIAPEVKYLTRDELLLVLTNLDESMRILCGLAFHLGARQGELFALTALDLKEKSVRIDWQMTKAWTKTQTKTDKRRKAYLLPEGIEWFKSWCSVPLETKKALRTTKLADIFKQACQKAFPSQPEKWCVFHDLRHSYAIYLLERSVPLSFVARSLGNSESVCEKYYTGFVLTEGFIETIDLLVQKRQQPNG